MNLNKANLALAIAAAALALPTWLTIAADQRTFVDVADVPRMFEGFTVDQVASLVMGEPKKEQPPPPANADPNQKPPVQYDTLTVQRADQGFVLGQGMGDLTGARVNTEMLEQQVWKHLRDIRADRETLVQPAATDEQLAEHGLDELHAFVLKVGNDRGQVLAELLVGKEASATPGAIDTVRGVFVRRADSRDVVLYEVPYWTRSIKTDIWLDRTVLKVTADTVRKLAIKNPTGEATFVKPKGKAAWEAERTPGDVGAVRQIEVEGLVQRCGFLQASQVLRAAASANLKQMGLEPPAIELAITSEKDGQETTVTLGIGTLIEGKNELHVRSSASNFVMTVAAHATTPFERTLTELFDPKAPPTGQGQEAGPTDPPKDAPKDAPKDKQDQPKDPASDAPKEEPKDAPKDAPKDGNTTPPPDAKAGESPAPGAPTTDATPQAGAPAANTAKPEQPAVPAKTVEPAKPSPEAPKDAPKEAPKAPAPQPPKDGVQQPATGGPGDR